MRFSDIWEETARVSLILLISYYWARIVPAAEITWTYFDRIGNRPFPSVADIFWLTGYGFFAYHLYRIYKFVGKNTVRQTAVLIVSITIAIALGYLVNPYDRCIRDIPSQEQKADDILLMLVSILIQF